jgi:hypothetical protein
MPSPYLDNVMDKFTPPIRNTPVDFYYKQTSDGRMNFAVYEKGRSVWERSYTASGAPASAPAAPAVSGNPYLPIASYIQSPDPSATKAPSTSGMQVFHPPIPFCPIAMGFWLPTGGSIGIAILFAYTNTILCYKACKIDPKNHSISMVQGLGPIGSCEIKFQLDYSGNKLVAMEGDFSLSGALVPNFKIPVKIPVAA